MSWNFWMGAYIYYLMAGSDVLKSSESPAEQLIRFEL